MAAVLFRFVVVVMTSWRILDAVVMICSILEEGRVEGQCVQSFKCEGYLEVRYELSGRGQSSHPLSEHGKEGWGREGRFSDFVFGLGFLVIVSSSHAVWSIGEHISGASQGVLDPRACQGGLD